MELEELLKKLLRILIAIVAILFAIMFFLFVVVPIACFFIGLLLKFIAHSL